MRRTTIQDVANLAGVGKVTVSYVLNGQSKTARISDETAEKVLQAARDLNYRPNAVARMLATKETKTLAIVFQYGAYFSTWSSFTNEVMRGVCAATVELGYDLMLHTKHVGNPHTEADALADGRVDGVLILRDQDDATLKELLDRKFPVVQFFTRSDDSRAAWVDADNYYGGQLATRHLLELGHRRIAMIRGGAGSVSSNDRFNGYRDAMESAGVKVPANYGFAIENLETDRLKVAELMARKDRPTAIFCWSDDSAFSAMESCRALGYRIPEDVSFVGFDSLDACNRSVPPLTSIRQPIRDMAFEATQLLVQLVKGETPTRRQFLYPLTIDVRGSTAPAIIPEHEEVHP